MSLRNLFFVAAIFAGLFLSPPEAFAKKQRKESKKAQREQRKKAKRLEDQSELPPDSRESPPREYKMPPPRDPREVLAEMKASVQRSKAIDSRDKAIMIEALDLLSRIGRGKWILMYTPKVKLAFKVDHSRSFGGFYRRTGGGGEVWINKKLVNAVAGAKGGLSRREALWNLLSTLSHELTHHCQAWVPMWQDKASTPDRTLLYKVRELHARLEGEQVKDQLLELPAFRDVKARVGKSFFTKLKEAKLKTGASPAEAERFARTEFVKTFWRNRPAEPVVVGNERIFDSRQVRWNNFYNRYAFEMEAPKRGPKYYRATGAPIRDELVCAAELMGVEVTPEFFMKENTFRYEHGRLIGSVGGVKDLESDYLTGGAIHKRYANGKLSKVNVIMIKPTDGNFTEYWYGTKRVRATYHVMDGELLGDYLEFDYNGRQVADIPFRNGAPNGSGWVLEDGRRCRKVFRRGRCFDETKAVPVQPRKVR